MARRGQTIAGAAQQLIHERGPQAIESIVAAMVAEGRTHAIDPRRAVESGLGIHGGLVLARDGRWCSLADQLDGAILGTRLTALERRHGIVLLRGSLVLVERLLPRAAYRPGGNGIRLEFAGSRLGLPWYDDEDGKDVRDLLGGALADDLLALPVEEFRFDPEDEDHALREILRDLRYAPVLDGPPGWLPPLGPRDLLGIRLSSGLPEAVRLQRSQVRGPYAEMAADRIADLVFDLAGPDTGWSGPPGLPLVTLLELIATEAPEVLRWPLPPVAEVLATCGLEVRDGWVSSHSVEADTGHRRWPQAV